MPEFFFEQSQSEIKDVALGCPYSLQKALDYSCSIKYDETPDYGLLHRLLGFHSSTDAQNSAQNGDEVADRENSKISRSISHSEPLINIPDSKKSVTHKVFASLPAVHQVEDYQENAPPTNSKPETEMDIDILQPKNCVSDNHAISISCQQQQEGGTYQHLQDVSSNMLVKRNFSHLEEDCISMDTAEMAPLARRRRLAPDPVTSYDHMFCSDESDSDGSDDA